ncbi:hypothetical protein [Ureibacillus acetophenoni]|uniref:Uncharacterized protein n=1 Tax=Ureibacillus acetophenoni TaxID=614649 RepID=A0A285US68_9BACL|nr:hypothetical protein [Ureibacillus acetophenoni]SOC44547.1 hypothetical protein SAMN05877842_12127 [Ureibacillus acetophenoni]
MNGDKREIVIDKELLNVSEVEYLEILGIPERPFIIIEDEADIKKIVLLLQQLNGLEDHELQLQTDDPLLGLSVALKGHYPSGAIRIYEDKISHGKSRFASEELIEELMNAIESAI